MTDVHPATVPTDGSQGKEAENASPLPMFSLGTGDRSWLRGARAVYSGHREQSTAMTQEPGRGAAQGGSWNSV